MRTLKQELGRARDALKVATKRCRDLVRELDSRTADHESERCLRDQQLSRILRALLVLESRLKQEQKSIRQLLCEKDNVIRNQQLEIAKLRRYTKNYIKCKRESHNRGCIQNPTESACANDGSLGSSTTGRDLRMVEVNGHEDVQSSELENDIQRLKREIIDKLNVRESEDRRDEDRQQSASYALVNIFYRQLFGQVGFELDCIEWSVLEQFVRNVSLSLVFLRTNMNHILAISQYFITHSRYIIYKYLSDDTVLSSAYVKKLIVCN